MDEDFLLQHEDRTSIVIHRPDGMSIVPLTTQTAGVTTSGVRIGTDTTHAINTLDGRLVTSPAELYSCSACGRGPWSNAAITFCPCGRVICRQRCTKSVGEHHRCAPCAWQLRWEAFWSWLAIR